MSAAAPAILEARDVSVRFGGVAALTEACFTARQGEISAVIGPNGAGKTTLFNVITGMVTQRAGQIILADKDISRTRAHERGRAGILRTFQNLEVFTNMSVLQNVMTGCHRHMRQGAFSALFKTPGFFREEERVRHAAMRQLEFMGLSDDAQRPAGDLPFGGQRLLEMARALAADPVLLLLDEPAAGMNIKETKELGGIITRIRNELGVSVALVEHDMDLVMSVSDTITVLSFGTTLAVGTPAEIQKNPEVVAAYLGE